MEDGQGPGMEPGPPPTRSHDLRTGMILASALVLTALVVGVVAVTVVLHRLDSDSNQGGSDTGAPDRQTVVEGRPFTFHRQHFVQGWSVQRAGRTLRPVGLVFAGEDDSARAPQAYVELRVYRRGSLVGISHCHSEDSVEPGSPNQMLCSAFTSDNPQFDRLEIADFRLSTESSS